MQDFHDKVVVITGGASGIGYALAERFAREGSKLVIADIEAAALDHSVAQLRDKGAEVLGVVTDVSKRQSVEALLAQTLAAYDKVHVVFNNAGVQASGPSWLLTQGQWEWVVGVNLWGVVNGVNVFVPHMLAQGDECYVVNTASVAGFTRIPFMSAYQVTKHAVVALSEGLASDLAQFANNVSVSVLCPAYVQSNLHEAERNRPTSLRDGSRLDSVMAGIAKEAVTQLITTGKPAAEVAESTIRAMRERRLYVLTHPAEMALAEERWQQIASAPRG